MNYKIITDEKALKDFINWLPDLKKNETYYLSLLSRKKYSPRIIKSNNKTVLKRFTSNKKRMYDKIKQLELPMGCWKLKNQIAPQESLVIYINPNPRCQIKAAKAMAKKCLDLIFDNNKGFNLQAETFSCIQKSKSYNFVINFDIDTKDIDLNLIEKIIPSKFNNKFIYKWLETRGGYHLLVNPKYVNVKDNYIKNWYKTVTETYSIDLVGDNMIPVVGTYQGGFSPKFINKIKL